METQLVRAQSGEITPEMRYIAETENVEVSVISQEVASGRMVVPANFDHTLKNPVGIGSRIRCKVNANLGNSPLQSDRKDELHKLHVAVASGADTVMDLSTGEHIQEIRRKLLAESPIPLGTVPIYEAMSRVDGVDDLTGDLLLDVIHDHAKQGVDYITVHCGVVRKVLPDAEKRLLGIVSRGGAILASWMRKKGCENPLFERYDEILAVAREHDVTLSLGDGLRPGCLADASDRAQFGELEVLADLASRARKAGVQVMVEGPGHVPIDQIEDNIKRQIELCDGAPFYVLGPVVTDIAPGYDHITSAVGASLAAYYGAAMICYVTPREHLGLPQAEDVREGVYAARLAAHAGDVARGLPGARSWDDRMAEARRDLDWEKQFELALDPHKARALSGKGGHTEDKDPCSMCGPKFCSIRLDRGKKKS